MINDQIYPKGQLNILLTGSDGKIKVNETVKNLVVDAGKGWIAARMTEASIPDEMSHMAVGD